MHIVLHHDATVPPRKYGGTERIVFWLAKGLVELGHEATLLVRKGSVLPAGSPNGLHLVPLDPAQPSGEDRIPKGADILHLSATPSSPPKLPFIVTIHGNGRPGETFHPNTVFLSRAHAANHGSDTFVYNGIDPEEYPCDLERNDSLVFLAKASWKVKNLHGAIETARLAGLPLEVLGSRDWLKGLHRLLPRFGGVRYHGMVNDEEKRRILRKARALLFPVRWAEPFGIAVTEALASGCAVFGTPYGSLPEIVTPEVGLLSTSARELARAVGKGGYSPERCRARVFQGFTHRQMAESYLRIYERVLTNGTLSESRRAPRSLFEGSPQNLLPWVSGEAN